MIPLARLRKLAHERLPSALAERYCSLGEPRGQILSAATSADVQVGALGGEPCLPETVDWPVWEGHGPLSFVASLDCGRLPDTGLALPTSGVLLFFFFDGQADDHQAWVHPSEPASRPGARILHVPAGTPVLPRPAPSPLKPYPRVPLRAEAAVAAPEILGDDHETLNADPAYAGFEAAVDRLVGVHHQVGGEPSIVQGEVEYEVADFPPEWDLDQFDPDNPHFDDILAEVGRWQLLFQVASDEDADMMWGDGGALYWLIDPEDLAGSRFDQARFTWQCH